MSFRQAGPARSGPTKSGSRQTRQMIEPGPAPPVRPAARRAVPTDGDDPAAFESLGLAPAPPPQRPRSASGPAASAWSISAKKLCSSASRSPEIAARPAFKSRSSTRWSCSCRHQSVASSNQSLGDRPTAGRPVSNSTGLNRLRQGAEVPVTQCTLRPPGRSSLTMEATDWLRRAPCAACMQMVRSRVLPGLQSASSPWSRRTPIMVWGVSRRPIRSRSWLPRAQRPRPKLTASRSASSRWEAMSKRPRQVQLQRPGAQGRGPRGPR